MFSRLVFFPNDFQPVDSCLPFLYNLAMMTAKQQAVLLSSIMKHFFQNLLFIGGFTDAQRHRIHSSF